MKMPSFPIKPWLLRLHRWLSLAFALPLLGVVATGLVLSFEPTAQILGANRGLATAESLAKALATHDPKGEATSLAFRSYEGRLSLNGVGPDGVDVDLATNQTLADEGFWSTVFYTSRVWHEELIFDLGWLVTASTWAMLVIIGLGIFMGWPRFANTVSGWHRGAAWIALPLVILSPLTGLAIVHGVTFTTPTAGAGARPAIAEAVKIVAAERDLSGLIWLRRRGERLLVRLMVDGEARVYQVTREGLTAQPRNWPRLIHEGNWGGHLSAGLNVATSVVLLGLLGTGVFIWQRRFLRKRRPRSIPTGASATPSGATLRAP